MSDELKIGLIIGCSVILLLSTIIIIMLLIKKSKNKVIYEYPELIEALGGLSNISNITLNGSRISLSFESKKNINKEQIKECGVETIVVSNKKITLVIGKNSTNIYTYLKKNIEA